MNLVIVDIGCGNIGSVGIAFERFGLTPLVTDDAHKVTSADRVILPGVGAAGYAMQQIEARGLHEPLRKLKQPVLGICLGMQLLFERSEEGDTECLGLLQGSVRKLDAGPDRPVPHIGWSKLNVGEDGIGIQTGDYVYFAHSYACDDGPYSIAAADYGRPIPAVVRRGNYLGAQFHPERSGEAGGRFLKTFLSA